jgi:hypothetical protein
LKPLSQPPSFKKSDDSLPLKDQRVETIT